MSSQRSLAFGPALTLSMLLFAAGTIFGIAVHSCWAPEPAPDESDASSSTISRAEWDELRAAVARLEAAAQAPELVAPDLRSAVGPSPVAQEALDTLSESVRALQGALERLRVLVERPSSAAASSATPREIVVAAPAIDWKAIDALRDLCERDEAAAFRSVSFSTPNEILARFGEPTLVYRYDKGLAFAYTRDVELADGETESRGVRFAFADGVLDNLWSE
ncbi:MAG: hypothetical protein HZA52_10665 [Planctomycetes bacterium]|nr:hypothetical protein [Planctomycetota bacterium]